MTLYEKLKTLKDSDMLPLHMPGHKRSGIIPGMRDIYAYDITEIDGFDDLHDPSGIIYDMQEQAADLFGAKRAWISVNGSSAAIEAAITASSKTGDKILVPRGSHKSVYYAIETAGLKPVYIRQHILEDGALLPPAPSDVEQCCTEHRDARQIVITSPTYEGIIADIEGIARIAHRFGMKLIVDSAHGAHLSALKEQEGMPVDASPLKAGADISIVSLHKMLPAPTQTALLLSAGQRDEERISHYMQVFQSSSPSYVLMAGVGECLKYISDRFEDDYVRSLEMMTRFRNKLKGLRYLDVSLRAPQLLPEELRSFKAQDPFKAVIRSLAEGFEGQDLYIGLLNKYHIQCEMYLGDYALAFFTTADNEEAYDRLAEALTRIDSELEEKRFGFKTGTDAYKTTYIPQAVMTPGEAMANDTVYEDITDNLTGRTCGSYISVYPPGIPVIVPGELVDSEVIGYIKSGLESGLHITGVKDGQIAVLKKNE